MSVSDVNPHREQHKYSFFNIDFSQSNLTKPHIPIYTGVCEANVHDLSKTFWVYLFFQNFSKPGNFYF